jgi:hypothetical protein
MRDLILKNPLTAVLGLACTVLAAILAMELLFSSAPPVISTPPLGDPRPPSSLKKDDFSLPPLSRYREIVERPLFLQSRRPVPKASSGTSPLAAKETPLDKQYALTAVIIVPDKRLALIRGTTGKEKKIWRLEEGQDFQGWKLKEIGDESAKFQQGNQESQELRLQRKTPKQFAYNKRRPPVSLPGAVPRSAMKDQGRASPRGQSQEKQPQPPPSTQNQRIR